LPEANSETGVIFAGPATLFTSIVLSAGFIGFTLSSMQNLVNFGLLTTLTITTALVSEIFLGPGLLAIADRAGALQDASSRGIRGPEGLRGRPSDGMPLANRRQGGASPSSHGPH
jgi:hypothetical protein